jgi:hypothetical protein
VAPPCERQRGRMLVHPYVALRVHEPQERGAPAAEVHHELMRTTLHLIGEKPVAARYDLTGDRELCKGDDGPDPECALTKSVCLQNRATILDGTCSRATWTEVSATETLFPNFPRRLASAERLNAAAANALRIGIVAFAGARRQTGTLGASCAADHGTVAAKR